MKMCLVIDGESAKDLNACGIKDILNHFCKEGVKFKKQDVVTIWFEELTRDSKEITKSDAVDGQPYKVYFDKYKRKD